ncbi:MAG: DUF1729 domain-containing protein [Candidatus Nanopelagicales bacterium]|nr:DUF1729 domain-containing protein [Candidatus Nanopelagicales bacterium]
MARRPGKPVPFVPVVDADVRRWYQSDSLWQSHSDLYDADQVLIIPGPVAVSGITTVDEPVAHLLDRFETAVAEGLAAAGTVGTDVRDVADFRLGQNPAAPASGPEALLAAALEAPTWTWMGASRTNPLHRIGSPDEWSILGPVATWSSGGNETATLTAQPDRSLALTLDWPDLGLPGDGELVLPVEVATHSGVVTFSVTEASLEAAGSELLTMFAGGTEGPTSPAEVAAAHAATVGAAGALPDRVMSSLWPHVFAGLAEAGLASSMFDLVHLSHEILAQGADADVTPGADRPSLARADGGLVITVDSRGGSATVSDRFFVRRAVVDTSLPMAAARAERAGVVATPLRTLGTLTVTAPSQLEAFATVSGDANPIHRSDLLARFVGLPGRIVHGMWTSAAATRAVLESAAEGESSRLREWSIDFVAPVLPGQEVTFTVTRTGVRDGARVVSVEATTADGVVALGSAVVAGPRTMYVFPGQGIQSQGMGMEAYARSAAARDTWDRADAATRERMGFSILEIVRENPTSIEAVGTTYRHPAGVLHLTQFTQVAMATLAMATVAEMREAGVFDPEAAVAGHSVGEYNALGASNGVLTLEGAIELVFARGQGMHGLVPRDEAGNSEYRLAVIRPHLARLSHAQAEELVTAVAADTGELCEIVNHNLRGKQYAVAGTLRSLAELERRIGPGQPGRAPMLLVPGIDVPFHSSALLGGVADFRKQLMAKLPERIDTEALVGRYIPNLYPHLFRVDRDYVQGVHDVCASPILADILADWDTASSDPTALARTLVIELLAWQFASPVRWIETFELMCTPVELGGLGVERIVEIGVGSAPTLANLAKGSLALPTHRGTRPEVLNVEVDSEVVFDTSADPAPVLQVEQDAQAEQEAAPTAPTSAAVAAPAPSGEVVADLPVDHATAVAALLALRVGVRVDQLEHDSIESLVDGASSRRNQVLMDIGKEFGVSAMDGAHEVPLVQLTSTLAAKTGNYRYPGPVLSAAVEGAVTAALGPRGSSQSALAKRVSTHWGLGEGWIARSALALALGTREGSSRRGGDLATLTATSAEGLIDEAVRAAAAEAGVSVSPVSAATAGGGTVDAAAVNELREHVEGILVDQASEVLARLGRVPVSDPLDADYREALATLALLEAEHGPASLVAPMFDPRRHVLLDSATTWARADVDHMVQAALAAEVVGTVDDAVHDSLDGLLEQVAAHRDADPRIRASLVYHRTRLAQANHPLTVALIERALTATATGVPVPDAQGLRAALASGDGAAVLAAAERLGQAPADFGGEVALVTGASPNSIAWSAVAHLLRGGATVVVVTTTDTPERIAAYRDLERRHAGPGAQLHIVRANLASFADIDSLIEWMVTPTTEDLGPTTREVKPALWPTLVLPFAAAPALGELPDTGRDSQLTLRLLLLGVQRLVGGLAERAATARRERFSVILPMSPNHGTFGGDGAYGDAKAALETMANKWASEGSRWGAQTRIISAEIGWVRGTGLMAANDRVARYVEDELGVVTYSAEQMGALIAALATEPFRGQADRGPLRLDLSGGLAGRADLGAALARAVAELTAAAAGEGSADRDADATVAALPNLPALLAGARGPVEVPTGASRATVRAEDMIVMVGIAEYGPWGASETRWQAELGELGAAGVVELAWRCGLIDWDAQAGGWVDVESAAPVPEAEVGDRYRERVQARSGVRLFEADAAVAAEGVWEFTEAFLDRALTKVLSSEDEARAMAASTPGALVTQAEEGWLLTLPAGASVRIPRRRPLLRAAGGQFPRGSDPVRHGLDSGIAGSMDALTAWNVVITADALADAGVSAEELLSAVHPSLVGNTQGSGMGGMSSISKVFMGPLAGRQYANDVLQEALGNVVSAHVNQGLIGGYGPMVHPVAACATAAVSLEEAVDKIALGKAEIIIGGGWDDLSTEGIIGFANMAATADNEAMIEAGLYPRQHSRPGDRRRRGFVESQGGGSFIICRGSVALALGLPVRAVVGYAASFGDGIHTSIPAPGIGALGSVRGGVDSPLGRALARLGLTADDVAVVSKHDTSTEANDPNEAFLHETIQQALGRTPGAPLRVISQKSLTGHSKGGAAAWQMAGLCDVFQTGTVPGNANLVSADPRVTPGDALVVDYRPLRRAEQVRAALVTSLGFGHVSALVALAHPDVFVEAIAPEQRADYVQRAHERRVAGARARLDALHGGDPVFVRRTDRRLGQGSTHELREREAGMLLDPAGALPGLVGS